MKKNPFLTFAALFILGAVLVPAFALANRGGQPVFNLLGVSDLQSTSATINVTFDSGTADYAGLGDSHPTLAVQYMDNVTGSQMTTDAIDEDPGTRTTPFVLSNLTPFTTYQYRVVMTYNGGIFQTMPKTFTTPQAPVTPTATTTTTTIISSGTGSGGSAANTSTTSSVANTIGVSKVADNLQNILMTGGYGSSNGVALSITDSHARVVSGDSITYTLQYHNSNNKTLHTARIVVQLPNQYVFGSGDANTVSDTGSNIVTIYVGSIEPGESAQVTFTAKAVGPDNIGVSTNAKLIYLGGSVSATDKDTYVGGSRSVLGASVFGAGFFPQSFIGWLLVILILIIVVISARRYMKAPKPKLPDGK